MHSPHTLTRKVALLHFLRQKIHLTPGVAINNRLRDGERCVKVAKRVQLPLFPLNCDEELLDTLQGQLVPLH